MRIALVDADGNVVNVVEASLSYVPPPGLAARADPAGTAEPSGRWDGQFRAPTPPAAQPDPLKQLEARIAALEARLP